ncbi:hypothetical protein FACS1894184_15490 [Clostridia bacterium]|nr:hypothetical protein FACS1894184_15490 [Clostridia bacterium]
MTATALKYVVFAMFAANINQMLSRGFYAMQKTKLPAIISAICVLINIFCVFAFIGPMHYKGLALATSISGMVGMLANYIFLRRELKSLQVYSTPEWIKLLASVAVMSIIIILGKSFLPLMNDSYLLCIISLVGLVGVSVLVYAGLLVILKTEISTMIINIFVNRKNTTTSEVPI